MYRIVKKAAALIMTAVMITAVPNCSAARRTSYAEDATEVSAVWPVDTSFQSITTYFDPMRNESDASGYHNAIDIEAEYGANIYAAYAGTCISADWMDAYGYMIILFHEELGIYTFYAHCSSVDISAGTVVSGGDVIGHVGSTGQSSGNHLHFGICDTLLSGWPCRMYYDPLSYFRYDGTYVANPNTGGTAAADCDCSDEYAGIYTTKDVTSYLNIRAGHSSDTASVGQIPAGAEVTVTKSDGKWAHVSYNGISGYSSIDYLEKISDIESGMTIVGETAPTGNLTAGASFVIKGVISSNLPIAKVSGGIYDADEGNDIQTVAASPNTTRYDLASYFDKHLIFGKLAEGTYIYRIEAEDSDGNSFTLVETVFTVGSSELLVGDLNGDGKTDVSDAVILQNYLLKGGALTVIQYAAADMNGDKSVDTFDLILMRQKVSETYEPKSE